MRFEKMCPVCYQQWQSSRPDWSEGKWKSEPRPSPIKPVVIHQRLENDEIIISVRYERCGHIAEIKRPYKGIKTVDGYVMVKSANGYMPEHRFVWEQAHAPLEKGWVVHHINGIKCANRLENLIALPRHSHNSSMAQPKPVEIECPHCHKEISIIKGSARRYIVT